MERRLAAILAVDAVGYSRLMGKDEVGTLDALKSHSADLLNPNGMPRSCDAPALRIRSPHSVARTIT